MWEEYCRQKKEQITVPSCENKPGMCEVDQEATAVQAHGGKQRQGRGKLNTMQAVRQAHALA